MKLVTRIIKYPDNIEAILATKYQSLILFSNRIEQVIIKIQITIGIHFTHHSPSKLNLQSHLLDCNRLAFLIRFRE